MPDALNAKTLKLKLTVERREEIAKELALVEQVRLMEPFKARLKELRPACLAALRNEPFYKAFLALINEYQSEARDLFWTRNRGEHEDGPLMSVIVVAGDLKEKVGCFEITLDNGEKIPRGLVYLEQRPAYLAYGEAYKNSRDMAQKTEHWAVFRQIFAAMRPMKTVADVVACWPESTPTLRQVLESEDNTLEEIARVPRPLSTVVAQGLGLPALLGGPGTVVEDAVIVEG